VLVNEVWRNSTSTIRNTLTSGTSTRRSSACTLTGHTEHTLDGTSGPRLWSCVSWSSHHWTPCFGTDDDYADSGSSNDEDTVYNTRTREGSHVEQGPILNHVVCCLSTLFHLCNDVFSIQISVVAGCSMPTICERDRERVGHAGWGSRKQQHSAHCFRGM
jgi:hypothetical protein